MKRFALAVVAMAIVAGCASSGAPKAHLPDPGIGLDQVVGPAELGYPYGPIEVRFDLAVQNNADDPITLTRLDLSNSNPSGGAYSLQRRFYNFREMIPPKTTRVITVWAKAFAWGRGMRDMEPVTVRGIAYFESPKGALQKIFIRELSQYPQ